jgi:hypothetical protein
MNQIRVGVLTLLALLLTLGCAGTSATQATFEQLRQTMVDRQLASRGITDRRVLDALRKVPRHLFVPEDFVSLLMKIIRCRSDLSRRFHSRTLWR